MDKLHTLNQICCHLKSQIFNKPYDNNYTIYSNKYSEKKLASSKKKREPHIFIASVCEVN